MDYFPKLSLVIPTYNESKNVGEIIDKVSTVLNKIIPNNFELIVVDDNSKDKTWEIAQKLVAFHPHLRVIRRQHERGLATAVTRGWQEARGKILGVIDADLQHPPEILAKLLAEIEDGADLAVASRYAKGGGVSDWNILRRIISRGGQLLGLIVLPEVLRRLSDPMSGYFLVRSEAIAERTLSPLGYKILIEVLAKGNIRRISEVGYVFQERSEGSHKVTWRVYIEYLLHLIKLRFTI